MMRATLAASCCLLVSCAAGTAARQRADSIATDIRIAREQNGETCAPQELAVAEANLRFAQLELDRGDSRAADGHLTAAAPAARDALVKAKGGCGTVVVQRTAEPAPVPRVSTTDADGDGVPDVQDLCPDVPGPAERRGCPLFSDRDGDGVSDDIDRCPELPGARDNFGCPWPDRDGDRIADKDDRCPDEPGTVENQGCPQKLLIVIRKDRIELKQQIHFQPNRAVIISDSNDVLRQVAQAIKDNPNISIRIEGHTDNVGKRKENVRLSQSRAEAVREFLVQEGVDSSHLKAVGYGPKRPIASNHSRAGRTLNRRVEFRMEERAN